MTLDLVLCLRKWKGSESQLRIYEVCDRLDVSVTNLTELLVAEACRR
jgi:hypothetical protein